VLGGVICAFAATPETANINVAVSTDLMTNPARRPLKRC
jgi:hypothetical protein